MLITKKIIRTRLWIINSGGFASVSIIGISQGQIFYLPAALISFLVSFLIMFVLIELALLRSFRRQQNLSISKFRSIAFTGIVFLIYLIGSGGVDVIPLRYHSPNPPNLSMIFASIMISTLTFASLRLDCQHLRPLSSGAKRS